MASSKLRQFALLAILAFLFSAVGSAFTSGVTASAGTAGGTWAFQNQNQQNTGYSTESVINSSDVADLVPAWSTNLSGLAGTPVVSGGVVYVAGPPNIYAVKEKSGALLWEDGAGTGLAPGNYSTAAGMTISGGRVYAATANNDLVALNGKTGAVDWNVSIISGLVGNAYPYEGAEATPLVYNGLVIVGETQGDVGPSRGVIQAFKESDGAHVWTFYTVPPLPTTAKNQGKYGNTWGTNGTEGCYCGGAMVWNVPAVDPSTGIIYFGTGNPYPADDPFARAPKQSDVNLYADSVIALKATTGKLVWYFQEIPAGYYDWDQGMPIQLFSTVISGVSTKVVGVGGKAGIYFELDAATGAEIYHLPLGIHLNDDIPAGDVNSTGFTIYPGGGGGINTFSSYSPLTGMVYSMARNKPDHCRLTGGLVRCPPENVPLNSTLYAIDASTGAVSWSTNIAGLGGGVSGAADLIFYSDGNHTFYAADAETGAILWQYKDSTGSPYFWSWGPPSIVGGLVLWTTFGTSSSPGHLIAFKLAGGGPSGSKGSGASPPANVWAPALASRRKDA